VFKVEVQHVVVFMFTGSGVALLWVCMTVMCRSALCARDAVAGSGVDGCEDYVSCSGCLSMNAPHTSTSRATVC